MPSRTVTLSGFPIELDIVGRATIEMVDEECLVVTTANESIG